MKVRSNALSLLASVGITAYCAHAATGDPVPPPSLRDLDLVEKPWPELASSWRHFLPAHEPGANQPTPDPSQEGNWPAGAAPLLGGAGGGFRATMRAQHSGKSLPAQGEGIRDAVCVVHLTVSSVIKSDGYSTSRISHLSHRWRWSPRPTASCNPERRQIAGRIELHLALALEHRQICALF